MKQTALAMLFLLSACGSTPAGDAVPDVQPDASDTTGGDTLTDASDSVDSGVGADTSDTADVPDTNTCPADQGGACCCAGDVAEKLVCSAGTWQCPSGFGKFYGDQCNGSKCGGPCSLPCPMDVVDSSDVQDDAPVDSGEDTAPEDTATPEDTQANGNAALCTSTGGEVVTGKCCTAASDFPDECAIGGCTCAPQYLKDIQKCNCAGGKCFTPGTGCH